VVDILWPVKPEFVYATLVTAVHVIANSQLANNNFKVEVVCIAASAFLFKCIISI